jgi:hypothetical protein
MDPMPKPIPASTNKSSLRRRLLTRERERWPEPADVQGRFRGCFADVDGRLETGEVPPRCRLRDVDSASRAARRSMTPHEHSGRTT